MIVPVRFSLESDGEPYDADGPLVHPSLALGVYAKLRLSLELVDTGTGQRAGFSGLVLMDSEESDPYRAGGVLIRDSGIAEHHREYLTRLRDHLDELLGDR